MENERSIEELRSRILNESTDYKYALEESCIVAITDQKGIITYANDNFCNISKYSRSELIGQDHRIINSGYHPKEFIRSIWVTIANGKIWRGELKNKAKDGTIYWVDTTIVPFLNAEGKPYQYIAIRADITERKSVEENLQKSLKEVSDYKYALDESSIVAITDQKGIIIYANDNFCAISKYSRNELIGQDHRIVNSGYHTPDFIRSIWVAIANGKIWRGELKNKAKDGTIYWVDTTIIPFLNEFGKPYQYVAIRADITERKKVEENLQKSLKETSDYKYALDESSIVAITDQKGIIKHVNNNFCKISKYESSELIGQDHRIINSSYHSKDFIRNLWVTIANGNIWRGELKNKAKDGTIYWVDTTIIPFLNADGKPYQYIAIRADITERKSVEENLQRSLKEVSDYQYALNESSIVAITDQKGIIIYANDNFCAISKYSRNELIGQDHRIVNSGYHTLDFIRSIWVTIANGKIWRGELKNKAKDGTIYWVDTTIIPFLNESGKPYQYVAIRADITERKKVEENLQKSLKETSDYKYALDESSIVAITDQKGIIKHVNNNFCKISKYKSSELIGQDHRIINSGYHSKDFIRNLWVTIAKGNIWRGELKNKAKDGSTYWVDTTIVPFLNEDSKPYQYVAIRYDITERKMVEDLILANKELTFLSEEKEKRAGDLKIANDKLFVLSDEKEKRATELIIANEALMYEIEEKEKRADEMIRANMELAYQNKEKEKLTAELLAANNELLFQNDEKGKRAAELSETLERVSFLASIADNIQDPVISLDDKMIITRWNDAAEKLFEWKSEEVIGSVGGDVLKPVYMTRRDEVIEHLKDKGVWQGELIYKSKSDKSINALATVSHLKNTSGGEDGYLVLVRDITERKKAEEAVRAMNHELESFSYSISHDLRAPLRAINGYAKILEETYTNLFDFEGKRLLEVVQSNAKRMGTLIDDLLSFSRLGRKEIHKSDVNMTSLVRTVIVELNASSSACAEFKIHELAIAYADASLMKQVWINLLSNALKYSGTKEAPFIEINSAIVNDEVVYSVADNGVGFDMNYVHKLFGVFQRLHSAEEFEGTGVGLALVHRIITKQGGRIWAEAELGRGARFYFTLPS